MQGIIIRYHSRDSVPLCYDILRMVVGVAGCMAESKLSRCEGRYGNRCEVLIAVLDLGVLCNTCIIPINAI